MVFLYSDSDAHDVTVQFDLASMYKNVIEYFKLLNKFQRGKTKIKLICIHNYCVSYSNFEYVDKNVNLTISSSFLIKSITLIVE